MFSVQPEKSDFISYLLKLSSGNLYAELLYEGELLFLEKRQLLERLQIT